jgi:sulfur carrier protein ThiS
MNIKILRLGHSARTTEIASGSPVSEALEAEGLGSDGYAISVNGLGAGLNAALAEGDVVTMVPKVEGGC